MSKLSKVKFNVEYGAPENKEFKNSDGWTCTIRYEGRQYTFPFYMGYGHGGRAPKLKGTLECLSMDARAEDSSFEWWCRELGYDEDSRKAERIYKSCLKVAKNLRRVFGDDFDEIDREVNDEEYEEEGA